MAMARFLALMAAMASVIAMGAGAAWAENYAFPQDEAEAAFIENEVIATFYHEMGHALIDLLELPVLGREEDAADGLSVVLMEEIWLEDSAAEILRSDALSYELMAKEQEKGGLDAYFADEHSLNIQRYYNVVCLFYGANPEVRAGLATELGLPDDRAERCESEYAQASGSWLSVIEAAEAGEGAPIVMAEGMEGLPLADILAGEVATLNEKFTLPEQVTVVVADCDEANAFYYSGDRTITMCNEYAEYLQALWEQD
jgi:hypothetical protein